MPFPSSWLNRVLLLVTASFLCFALASMFLLDRTSTWYAGGLMLCALSLRLGLASPHTAWHGFSRSHPLRSCKESCPCSPISHSGLAGAAITAQWTALFMSFTAALPATISAMALVRSVIDLEFPVCSSGRERRILAASRSAGVALLRRERAGRV